jgi:hypothetical protein
MSRCLSILVLGGLAFAFSPGSATAQYRGMFMSPSPLYIYPTGNGGYGAQLNFGMTASSPYGPITLGYAYPYVMGAPAADNYPPSIPGGGYGYITGGSSSGYDVLGAQQGLAAAQQAATRIRKSQDDAKELIDAQWAYERLGVTGQVAAKGAKEQAEELQKALAVKDEAEVASGVSLNRILVAIVIAEGKGARGVSAFLPPQLLEDIRFSGGPSADLLNLIRQTGKIPFPPNFPAPSLEGLQHALEADFAAATAALRIGKPVDALKVTKLETSLKRLEAAAPPLIRNLSFDDAIGARRFLNQFDSALVALKGANTTGLINPKWATDGTSVSDLVKQMTKFKLMFAASPVGNEGSYFSLQKALATYLFVLTQPKK